MATRFCLALLLSLHAALAQGQTAEQGSKDGISQAGAVTYIDLARRDVERARADVDRVKALVATGALPQAKIAEAQDHLADVEDQLTLAETLYGNSPTSRMTSDQATAMEAAAQRRVRRAEEALERRRKLLELGIIAQADLEAETAELENRQSVRQLAEARQQLLRDIERMAETERRSQAALSSYASMQQAIASGAVKVFNGKGSFTLANLPSIAAAFEHRWNRELPVSAAGQTAVHAALNLDHRNRVDVALNPDGAEGIWLRHYLEKLGTPYLAFRAAIAGAATAPHIHIGSGSSRLRS